MAGALTGAAAAFFAASALPACGVECEPATGPVTYEANAKAVLDTHCVPCHSSQLTGDARHKAPDDKDYDSFNNARSFANRIANEAMSGTMPPAGNSAGAPELKEADACVLKHWADAGAPER